ncbi:hypothetical protein [Pseudoxanthomonas mexicana]
MRLYLDTEFNGFGGSLISAALVSTDGHEWYEVLPCSHPNAWVKRHVIPMLCQPPKPRELVTSSLQTFLMQFSSVQIVADWPEDIMHLCDLFVATRGHRMITPPISFELVTLGTPLRSMTPHNALSDAHALKRAMTCPDRLFDAQERDAQQIETRKKPRS